MRKVLILIVWVVVGLSGLFLAIYAPNSWYCGRTNDSIAIYNPRSSTILLASRSNVFTDIESIEVWRPAEQQPDTYAEISVRNYPVTSVAWSPDGQTFLTGNFDWTARLWDSQTGTAIKTLTGHDNPVR